MRNIVLVCLLSFVFSSLVSVNRADARVTGAPSVKMKVGIGLGYMLCPEKNGVEPPLLDAFLCPGLKGAPQTVELELMNKPAADPKWEFYESPYQNTMRFKDVTVTMKANISYAKLTGYTMGYVEGSLTSTQKGVTSAPTYFRVSAEGGLDHLTYSSTYGSSSPIPLSNGTTARFSPYVVIQAAP